MDPEEPELLILLGTAFQLVLGEFVRRGSDAGYAELRPVHGMAFQILRGRGSTATELAARLGVTKQAAGQIVDYLEQHGYVRREPHPDGGRRRLIVLTEKAHEHLLVAGGILHTLEAELTAATTSMSALRTGLSELIQALAGDHVPPLRPVW